MGRKNLVYGFAAILVALTTIALLRFCGQSPAVSRDFPPADLAIQSLTRRVVPKERSAPKKIGLVAPRLLNLDQLQDNIRKYYPELEHRAGKEGRVTLAMTVAADGSVSGVRVEASGGADFDEAAKKVALAMRFSPARRAGAPVAVEIGERIDFQFDKK